MINKFQTKDMYISAVLLALEYPLIRIEKSPQNVATFVFLGDPDELNQVVISYWNKSISVDARKLIDAIHEIKTRLHSTHV